MQFSNAKRTVSALASRSIPNLCLYFNVDGHSLPLACATQLKYECTDPSMQLAPVSGAPIPENDVELVISRSVSKLFRVSNEKTPSVVRKSKAAEAHVYESLGELQYLASFEGSTPTGVHRTLRNMLWLRWLT